MICCKDDAILLKNSAFRELQVLIELIFRFTFQFSIFILKESSKRCLIFSYFSTVFEKLANISQLELSFNNILILRAHLCKFCGFVMNLQFVTFPDSVLTGML